MNNILLEILRCPKCKSPLKADTATAWDGCDEMLHCVACDSSYPICQGVPRMLINEGLVVDTRKGFEYQWKSRQKGKAESNAVVYGYHIKNFMAWFLAEFTSGLSSQGQQSRWILDAGCGSAEKSRELALHFPQHQIIAIDQSDSIFLTAKQNADLPNLHFVQANVLHPPFEDSSLHFAMSIGVLHHTPDTRKAFDAVAALIAPGGDLNVWLYPLSDEDSFWAGLYQQRDRHFLGIAHKLPRTLLMFLCHAYAALLFPWILKFLKEQYTINIRKFPASIYPDKPTLTLLYKSVVFLSFDNLMPTHQFRHSVPEVEAWFREDGFENINSRYPGFFHSIKT